MNQRYELRHKDHTVLLFEYKSGIKLLEVIDPARLPILLEDSEDFFDDTIISFRDWYMHRMTDVYRRERRPEYQSHRVYDLCTPDCVDINYGANLADHYWICSEGSSITWKEINFFENDFEPANENSLWTAYGKYTPDNYTNGNLRKFWTIKDGVRYLVKYNSLLYDDLQMGAHNEVFCSKLLQKLGINHAEYELGFDDSIGEFYSLSKCMTDTVYELVPAYHIIYGHHTEGSYYDLFLDICQNKLGVDVQKQVDEMIAFDYLIANEDRHWNNFGLLRNSETLEYVGFAPLYDNEYSMPAFVDYFETRTFASNPYEQLLLINPEHKIMPSDDLLEETWDEVFSGDLGEKRLEMLHSGNFEKKNCTKTELIALVKGGVFDRAEKLRTFDKTKDKIEETAPTFQMYTR